MKAASEVCRLRKAPGTVTAHKAAAEGPVRGPLLGAKKAINMLTWSFTLSHALALDDSLELYLMGTFFAWTKAKVLARAGIKAGTEGERKEGRRNMRDGVYSPLLGLFT